MIEKKMALATYSSLFLPPLVDYTPLIRNTPAIATVGLKNGLQHEFFAYVTFFKQTFPLIHVYTVSIRKLIEDFALVQEALMSGVWTRNARSRRPAGVSL
jgi:hypothetical protein